MARYLTVALGAMRWTLVNTVLFFVLLGLGALVALLLLLGWLMSDNGDHQC